MLSRLHLETSRLEGRVRVSGAKNSALRLLAASLLTAEPVRLRNYPATLLDAQVHVDMLRALGTRALVADDVVVLDEPTGPPASTLRWEGRSIRNTLLVLGALTARTGAGAVPLPGGCQIGQRKYDLHEMLLRRLGARVWEEDGYLHAEAEGGRLRGADVRLPLRSTGATENALLCGSLASGTTRLHNPHVTPEVLDLVACLRRMGASIQVHGRETIEIEGSEALSGVDFEVMPDRIEAVTWAVAAVVTGGEIEVVDFPWDEVAVPVVHLAESGTQLYRGRESVVVRGRAASLDVGTGSHPATHSDMQPLLAVYATQAPGESHITDLRYPGRFAYEPHLRALGADTEVRDATLTVRGGRPLRGAQVDASDLRSGAALVLAGLAAEGRTTVTSAWQVERGYADLVPKLEQLGALVKAEYTDDAASSAATAPGAEAWPAARAA